MKLLYDDPAEQIFYDEPTPLIHNSEILYIKVEWR